MSRFKYANNSIVYMNEPFEKQVEILKKYGYDAIELVGETDLYNLKEVKNSLNNSGLKVSSICSLFSPVRDLCHPDPKERQAGLDYAMEIADMAAEVGAALMIVAPTTRTEPIGSVEDEWNFAVESIRKVGEYANSLGVKIAFEAWARYETYFLNRLDQCLALMDAVGLQNSGVHGDTFHMNIEEVDIADAYRKAGKNLIHTHIADSNRAAPGTGHIDFESIVRVLDEINYQGYVCFEMLPPVNDPLKYIREGKESNKFLDEYTKLAIETMKKAEIAVLGD